MKTQAILSDPKVTGTVFSLVSPLVGSTTIVAAAYLAGGYHEN